MTAFFISPILKIEFNINLFKNSTFFRNSLHPKNFSLSLHPSKCVLWGELYLLINKFRVLYANYTTISSQGKSSGSAEVEVSGFGFLPAA